MGKCVHKGKNLRAHGRFLIIFYYLCALNAPFTPWRLARIAIK